MSTTAAVHAPHAPPFVKVLADLTKIRISAMSTLTAAAGYSAYARGLDRGVLMASLGTLFFAMGASALNEVQEREYDALMARTKNRPLPTGALTASSATLIAIALAGAGFATLLAGGGLTAACLGLLAMVWYNGVYTPLKRVTAFAAIPGSLIGALPPAIGWAAAGGSPLDPAILALCSVFFIWQVPHFWLLLFIYGEDYERAGYPTMSRRFTAAQLSRLTFTWMCATSASCAMVPLFGAVVSLPATALLVASAAWLVGMSVPLVRTTGAPPFRRAFLHINIFALLVLASVLLDPLFKG